MTEFCWCVYYNSYIEPISAWFSIECVYYGDKAEEEALKKAINMNIDYIKQEYQDILTDEGNNILTDEWYIILNDPTLSDREKLEKFTDSLDYTNGNYKYDGVAFYDIKQSPITLS